MRLLRKSLRISKRAYNSHKQREHKLSVLVKMQKEHVDEQKKSSLGYEKEKVNKINLHHKSCINPR